MFLIKFPQNNLRLHLWRIFWMYFLCKQCRRYATKSC